MFNQSLTLNWTPGTENRKHNAVWTNFESSSLTLNEFKLRL